MIPVTEGRPILTEKKEVTLQGRIGSPPGTALPTHFLYPEGLPSQTTLAYEEGYCVLH